MASSRRIEPENGGVELATALVGPETDRVGLETRLVERVLAGLGFTAAPTPDLAGLSALYAAWSQRVPFDNVWKRIHLAEGLPGPLPGDDPAGFFERWLADGTGATCWAANGALCALLSSLGFRARRGVGTMLVAPDLPPNHGTVSVALDGERHLVDASMLFATPLRVRAGEPAGVAHPAWGVALRFEAGRPLVRWRPLHLDGLDCRIDSLESSAEEFRQYHEATRPWSPFNFSLYARLNRGAGVVGAAFGQIAEISPDGVRSVRPCTREERTRHLVETLGIREAVAARLPPDEPLPPPPNGMRLPPGLPD